MAEAVMFANEVNVLVADVHICISSVDTRGISLQVAWVM
jgi:hypothetical protein